ncbi:MAG: 4'-phosphopantetheinyl transferase superfamily protein [Firmicutes bacterium]|nr:4'-phosphopantetheinyl transferase superfamily protein [Bacillota bacterium]
MTSNLPKIRAQDVLLSLFRDNKPSVRMQYLLNSAHRYVQWRRCDPGDFVIAKLPGGKPYFPHCRQVHFSLSHSGEYWACAFSGQPLGLDIQLHEERNYLMMAKRWYHPEEYVVVEKYGQKSFFDIWSAKESVIKCRGDGFPDKLANFSVAKNDGVAAVCGSWQLNPLQLLKGYSVCLCAEELAEVYIEIAL